MIPFAHLLDLFKLASSESELHPHCSEERAGEFHSVDGGSAELETLLFLNSLVYLFKPRLLLETGTGEGFTTSALAAAMRANGFGTLHTVEVDGGCVARARDRVHHQNPLAASLVNFHQEDSRNFIAHWEGPEFEFAYFDSLIAFRHLEFEMLLKSGKLAQTALCVFHDTSRLRGHTVPDFNPEMIDGLDEASKERQWLESPLSRGLRVIRLG